MSALLDMFSTGVMTKAVELMPRYYTFLADTFGRDGETYEDENVFYDYRKGKRTGMAPFVVPGTGGVTMNREGYEVRRQGFFDIAPKKDINREDITKRMFGENVMGAMTPEQRAKKIMASDLNELRVLNQNRRNWMVRQMLLYGRAEARRFTNSGREAEPTQLFDFNFTNNYIPATKWNQAGAKIDYDMRQTFDLVYEGGGDVDVIVMGAGVFECMLNDSAFAKQLDMLHVDMGEFRTRYMGQGIRALGVNSDGVEMYSDSGMFLNDNRQMEKEIPDGWIVVGSRRNKGIVIDHGPITKVEGLDESAVWKTYIKKEVAFRKGGGNNDIISTVLESRPSVKPLNVDSWAIMKVL